jgi:hypothetical protein
MENRIKSKSSIISVFFRSFFGLFGLASNAILSDLLEGDKLMKRKSPVGFWDIITPWRISADINNRRITITKRNWYLIGTREDTYAFRSIRHISVRNHLFGADLGIRLFAGFAIVYSIPKSDAKKIKEILMNTDWNLHDSDVTIDVGGHI